LASRCYIPTNKHLMLWGVFIDTRYSIFAATEELELAQKSKVWVDLEILHNFPCHLGRHLLLPHKVRTDNRGSSREPPDAVHQKCPTSLKDLLDIVKRHIYEEQNVNLGVVGDE
jgi:hypothetical protein